MSGILQRRIAEDAPQIVAAVSGSVMEIIAELDHVARVDRRSAVVGFYLAFDKAGQALARIAREIGLADFAVIDDVEAAGELLPDNFGEIGRASCRERV